MVKKYNRTFHLPFSPGKGSDDKVAKNINSLLNKEIIITAKLDGSNFCMTVDGCFARSHGGPPTHRSFDFAKAFYGQIQANIPKHLAVFSEYCFAKHSIAYNLLPHYINVFNILNIEKNEWLSWDNVVVNSTLLNLPTVPCLFKGIVKSEKELKKIISDLMKEKEFGADEREGVVVRLASSFKDEDFSISTQKFVRKLHIKTNDHWAHQEITKNKLRLNSIETKEDYQLALKEIELLWNSKPNTPNNNRLDQLAILVINYEKKHFPM